MLALNTNQSIIIEINLQKSPIWLLPLNFLNWQITPQWWLILILQILIHLKCYQLNLGKQRVNKYFLRRYPGRVNRYIPYRYPNRLSCINPNCLAPMKGDRFGQARLFLRFGSGCTNVYGFPAQYKFVHTISRCKSKGIRDCRGRDRMIFGFTTTYAIKAKCTALWDKVCQ